MRTFYIPHRYDTELYCHRIDLSRKKINQCGHIRSNDVPTKVDPLLPPSHVGWKSKQPTAASTTSVSTAIGETGRHFKQNNKNVIYNIKTVCFRKTKNIYVNYFPSDVTSGRMGAIGPTKHRLLINHF